MMDRSSWVNFIPMFDIVPDQYKSVSGYAEHQRSRMLYVILAICGLVAFSLAIIYSKTEYSVTTIMLVCLVMMSILGAYANYLGRTKFAGFFFLFSLYAVTLISMADGEGLRNPAITVFPAIIIFSSLLFGKESMLVVTVVIILSIVGFDFLDRKDIISPDTSVLWDVVFALSVINLAIAVVQYTLISFWERNYSWAQQSSNKVIAAYEKTLEGWSKVLEYRDYETAGHSRRVVELSLQFAEKIGITDADSLSCIRIGALMHDIGKLAIPAYILEKDGPLDEHDWEEVKKHPLLAKDMLEDMPFNESVLDIPLHHHEWWNGMGYPYGLVEEEIPLSARLFSLVDNWDALRHDRPYRGAWSFEDSRSFIKENAGKRFDPELVSPFLDLIEGDERRGNQS